MSHYAFCGLSRDHLGELVTELAPLGYPAGVIPIPGDRPGPAGRRFFATSQAAEADLYRGERERAGRVRGKHHPSRNCAARWPTLNPDRGGTADQFIEARRRYETALRPA